MSGVVISKSPAVLVTPAETVTATGDISLSCYDKLIGPAPVTVFFVFEHAIIEPVETIERALSQALVHYYPLAGRFATVAGATADEVVIKCTGEGVSMVAASANCAIKDIQHASLKKELAVFFLETDGRYSEVDPFVLLQVTVFSCGGFVLGVTWNHAVADGIGIGQFVQAVGELARGLPALSVVPVRQDDSMVLALPPNSTSSRGSKPVVALPKMLAFDITVKADLISRIKDKYASTNSGRPCTVFEAVAAVLWRCRTRVTMSDPDAVTVLLVGNNIRKSAGAIEGYYGNCVVPRLVTASSGVVGNGDVMDLVRIVQRVKVGGTPTKQPDVNGLAELDMYSVLNITCWRNIGFEAPDFGGGRPERVMCQWMATARVPCCVACIPCKDEYKVLSICLKEDHVGAFLHELADMHLTFI